MSYQVLARKWRPRSFQTMVGQEAILRMLENALSQNRIHHAYLFTGTRGVGKTTLARIFTKCLNCETGISAKPCDSCANCKAIDAGQFLDLYEVDAASRTKVEDTRELLDNVMYPPTQGRYKVYLIDEVHMLSNHSFNALLKTLEEPPQHVKFLLATTDPKRLPITILSRCLQFHLKRIPTPFISKHLAHICQEEKIHFDLTALEALAEAADGSLRDALSLLDQAIAYSQEKITLTSIHEMLGSVAREDLFPLLESLSSQEGNKLLNAIYELADRAPDYHQILQELIHLLHQIALAQIVPSSSTHPRILSLAHELKAEDVQIYYQIALLGRRDLSFVPCPQQGFEMIMLRMLAFHPELSPKKAITEKESPPQVDTVSAIHWRELLPALQLSGMAFALASNCCLESFSDNKLILALSTHHQPMLNPKLKERIQESLNQYFKRPIQLDIKISTQQLDTPAKQQQDEQAKKLEQASQAMRQDPKVKQLIEMYDATLEISLLP